MEGTDQDEQIKRWRAMGIKTIAFHDGQLAAVEFFPRELLDMESILPGSTDATPTDRPPPAEDSPPNNVPPAIARILRRGSVS